MKIFIPTKQENADAFSIQVENQNESRPGDTGDAVSGLERLGFHYPSYRLRMAFSGRFQLSASGLFRSLMATGG